MGIQNLQKWADLLLDTGKGNNLINFKDTKSSTVEIMAPDFKTLVAKAEKMDKLEVYEILPDLDDEEIDFIIDVAEKLNIEGDKIKQINKWVLDKIVLLKTGDIILENE